MKKIKILTIIAIFALLQISCTDNTSGGETLNEKVALYMPDGITPAVDATVKFFSIGDTSATPIYQTQTDAEGRYTVSGVTSTGYYNVIAEYEDSLFTMQDTVYISQESNLVKDDTLNNPGSISGIVALQPNHSHLLNNVYVMALGMGRAVNVDSTGWFTMTKLAPGDYNLQFDTDIENYGPRFIDITISAGNNDTLSDTITLPYSGVPVVTGIRSSYDTLNGVATINWKKSFYGNVYSYLIFRKPSNSLFFPEDPIGWVSSSDTCYNDTIFTKPVIDSITKNFDYTIAILDSSTAKGSINSYIKVTAVSPLKVTTTISTNSYSTIGALADTFSIGDTSILITTFVNSTRNYKSVSWAFNHPDSIKKTVLYDSISKSISDTFTYIPIVEKDHQIYIYVEDLAGTIWYDTLTMPVWNYPEAVDLYIDSMFSFTAYLRWNKSNHNKFSCYTIQHSLDNSFDSILEISIPEINDTTLKLTSLHSGTLHYFRVGVKNSKNINVFSNTLSDSTNTMWHRKAPLPTPRFNQVSEMVNNKIYTIGGMAYDPNVNMKFKNTVEVYDLSTNTWISATPMTTPKAEIGSCVYDSKIFILGGKKFNDTTSGFEYLISVDMYDTETSTWINKSPLPVSKHNVAVEALDNEIYVIGGFSEGIIDSAVYVYNITSDSWTQKTSVPIKGYSKSTMVNDTIFLFDATTVDSAAKVLNISSYNKTSDSWNRRIEIPLPLGTKDWEPFFHNGVILISGVTGKWTSSTDNYNYLISYDYKTETFKNVFNEPMIIKTSAENRSYVKEGNTFYLIGGGTNGFGSEHVETLTIPQK